MKKTPKQFGYLANIRRNIKLAALTLIAGGALGLGTGCEKTPIDDGNPPVVPPVTPPVLPPTTDPNWPNKYTPNFETDKFIPFACGDHRALYNYNLISQYAQIVKKQGTGNVVLILVQNNIYYNTAAPSMNNLYLHFTKLADTIGPEITRAAGNFVVEIYPADSAGFAQMGMTINARDSNGNYESPYNYTDLEKMGWTYTGSDGFVPLDSMNNHTPRQKIRDSGTHNR